jgi:rare lipoprotein A
MKYLPGATTALLSLFLMLSGCGGHRAPVVKSSGSRPQQGISKNAKIPPTQKPYKIMGKSYYPIPSAEGFQETGLASWYGGYFHGRKTSNGETYDMYDATAAHKTLPMNTYLLVKNLENGREITVRVNDRGPFHQGRIIDMSKTGASKLGFIEQGTAKVRITALGEATTSRKAGLETRRFKEHADFRRGEFYIQIGSFADQNNARRLKDKMLAAGRKSVIQKFDRGDQIFFRVQVWASTSLTSAEQVEKELNKAGFTDTYVVAR